MVSIATSIIFFSITTLAYFILKHMLADKFNARNSGISIACTVVYLAIIVSVQTYINVINAREKCGGTPQTLTAMYYTFIPYLAIFGTLILILMFFPGFKAPFSNTLGYGFVSLPFMNIKPTFMNILKRDSNNKLLKTVYEDPSLMINEITPSNFFVFLSKMGEAQNSILSPDYKRFIPSLYDLVVVKNSVSKFVWFMLTGILVILNSHSYIMSMKCSRTVDELSGKLDKAFKNPKKIKKKQKWKLGY
jgi:hypothetical protein